MSSGWYHSTHCFDGAGVGNIVGACDGAYDGAPAASLAFYSTQFHENSAMHVRVGSGTTAAFYDCAFGALTDYFIEGMASGTYPHRGALVLEDNARADLYSCDFEAPWTLWMHPSAVAHVYCTYSAGLNLALIHISEPTRPY